MKFHPDRANGDKVEAETRFKECSEAYEVLSDQGKRRRYDQFGHEGVTGQHDFSHMDVTDIFSMFDDIFGGAFGGRGRGRARQAARGYDLETRIELSLQEVAAGTEKSIDFERQDRCDALRRHRRQAGHGPGGLPAMRRTGPGRPAGIRRNVSNGRGLPQLPRPRDGHP